MSESVGFRDASEEDIPAILRFIEPFVAAQHLVPRDERDLRTLVKHGFLAECAGRIVGFAAVEVYSRKLAEIQSLAVDPQFQRRGIGKQLVSRCVERAMCEGVLELMAITSSESLFRDSGFDYSLPNQKRALFLQTGVTRLPPAPTP